VSTKEIALWNNLSVNQQLKVGQTLTLFVNLKSQAKKKSTSKVDPAKQGTASRAESTSSDTSHKKTSHKKS
jgi:hypothetical protein